MADQVFQANIHSYLESDDRVLTVIKLIDETVAVIDDLDGYISSYKVQLNVSDAISTATVPYLMYLKSVADDISYIQSRNRGLQVQTQNQSALLNEIDQLLVSLSSIESPVINFHPWLACSQPFTSTSINYFI